jgi:hypothetical protein
VKVLSSVNFKCHFQSPCMPCPPTVGLMIFPRAARQILDLASTPKHLRRFRSNMMQTPTATAFGNCST